MYKLHLSSHNLDSKGIFGLKMLFFGGLFEVCESFIKIKTKPSMPVRTETTNAVSQTFLMLDDPWMR